eukprot:TRINITY_DN28816_c0_g1_i1.p1 TRINITY_DN28816_c0_g1~~TRINITY_DN28816_c0_g1_i1.p1  ORF type:complete len:796 (-),score=107.97 TRINITY_DN28816_c0_g1_i1:177-2564(-)
MCERVGVPLPPARMPLHDWLRERPSAAPTPRRRAPFAGCRAMAAGRTGHRVVLLLVASFAGTAVAGTSAGTYGVAELDGVECSPVIEELSTPTGRCCAARRAWREVEAAGGCGGGGKWNSACKKAEALCRECNDATRLALRSKAYGAALVGPDGTQIAHEMICIPPGRATDCALSSRDIGIVIVFLTGILLLVLCTSWVVFFDVRVFPHWVRRWQRRWSKGVRAAPLPPPLPPPKRVSRPRSSPPAYKATRALLAASPEKTICEDSPLRLAAACPLGAPRTEVACISPQPETLSKEPRPPSCGSQESDSSTALGSVVDSLRTVSAASGDTVNSPVVWPTTRPSWDASHMPPALVDEYGHPSTPPPAASVSVPSREPVATTPSVSRPSTPGSLLTAISTSAFRISWPTRLAKLWALRSVFLRVASVAVVSRALHTVFCALSALRPLSLVFAEIFVCVAPLIWVGVTSRPPPSPENALPPGIAHGFPCNRVPRFATFAALTVLLETYSTINAAWSVAETSCETEPWVTIGLHCFGVVVAVLHVYSAILGLRLQDEFNGAARRVMPGPPASPLATADIECDVNLDLEANDGKDNGTKDDDVPVVMLMGSSLPEETVPSPPEKNVTNAWKSKKPQPLDSPAVDKSPSQQGETQSCCRRMIKRIFNRKVLWGCILFMLIVAATATVWVVKAVRPEPESKPIPSACVTAQNATATCSPFESIGDSLAGAADSEEDCCRGCDELEGCQAWMFERAARRCRWIRFTTKPCSDDPGDIRCRCFTHFGTMFGFKPISQIVWLQRS